MAVHGVVSLWSTNVNPLVAQVENLNLTEQYLTVSVICFTF